MGRIQSSIGLITGVPITDTVDKLISLAARPRDLLIKRNAELTQQQGALAQLTALIIGVQLAGDKLGAASLFDKRTATSSNNQLLAATVTGQPPLGTQQFTPVRRAQTNQLLSSGFAAADAPLAAGSLSFRFGGFVDEGLSLATLNGGAGVQRGQIRITDRSGASAVVDLRFAQTVDDVLEAINGRSEINVTASADGDRIRLVDNTGQTTANLKVQQVGAGTTVANLGLAGIDVAASEVAGQDILRLYNNLALNRLNDGNGVSIRAGLPDLEVTFQDGSSALQIDLNNEATVGELLSTLNAADPARLSATISADGDRLELTDLTSGGGTFAIGSPLGGSLAEDLGFTGTAIGGVLTGRRLQGGLKSTLVSSFAGGQGLGTLGDLLITDRSGASTTVNLATAETLDDIVRLINDTPVGITARVNDARNGLVLNDTTGQSGSLVVANGGDGTTTADRLKIAVSKPVSTIDSGSLNRQVISRHTSLDTLNNGQGVQLGSLLITDSKGKVGSASLKLAGAKTVGDVLDAINALTIGVTARINDAGDGIALVDTAGGSGTLTVAEGGSSTKTAANLRLLGQATTVDVGGTPTQIINGSTTNRVEITGTDTLVDLVAKLNALGGGVTAAAFNDGSGENPVRFSLTSQLSGRAGRLLVDTTQAGFSLQQLAAGRDALLLIGSADSLGAGVLAGSSTDTFNQVLGGVNLTVKAASTDPVTVTIDRSNDTLISGAKLFVDQYNKLIDKIKEVTAFNEADNSTGLLFGSSDVLRIESGLSNLATRRFFGVGPIQTLAEVGVGIKDDGKLEFNEQKLRDRLAANPADVERFFTDKELGVSAKFDTLIETLAGRGNSLLINRSNSLQSKIDFNQDRVTSLSTRLDTERERLLTQFYNLENIIGKLQSSQSVVQAIQPLTSIFSSR